ncbi:ABC transporter permease [Bacillus sp. YZJH907-2]|uniref:ABC transporter permease n=2 Tax=Halalkalibacter suaedae TaxID=2822140 RepID=A0A941APY6_9BACI|nr:ABC transporter permease [Bacillus suaedae]
MMKIPQTKVGLIFAFILPLLFLVIWMTGYDQATERLDQLKIAVVNEDGEQGEFIQEQMQLNTPFDMTVEASFDEAKELLDSGDYAMVVVIPELFAQTINSNQETNLTFYINQANAQIATSIVENAAKELAGTIGQQSAVNAEIIKTNSISNFATSMLPMILGFITYIAIMTMAIQFNLVSMILQKHHSVKQIFWSKQLLLIAIALLMPLFTIGLSFLFNDVASLFWEMYGFHVLVTLSCISFTQMSFTLFGNAGALFNVAMVPLQLLTAGNIIPTSMLAPLYQNLGGFLPASNGVQGFTKLIYAGSSVNSIAVNLVLITVITFGITIIAIQLKSKSTLATMGQVNQPAH